MEKRFMSIWFRHLVADWMCRKQPELKDRAFVLASTERGRMVVKAAGRIALSQGIQVGTVVADARAICPALLVLDAEAGRELKLLEGLGEWFIRYSPIVATDLPDGLMLDISGCAHLWGGEASYLKEITIRLKSAGYDVSVAIADTIGAAWAIARFGQPVTILDSGKQATALSALPPEALRLEQGILDRLKKLGFYRIANFMDMPRTVLRRRFGQSLLDRLGQALGEVAERLEPIRPLEPYQERLPCLEAIHTATGIEIALKKLLGSICSRLQRESKGLRSAILKCYRVDGKIPQIEIGTNYAARNTSHLFKLFELKISTIKPGLGIELFILEAPVVEGLSQEQETLWVVNQNAEQEVVTRLLDRIAVRAGMDAIRRYLPDEHYWPERSIRLARSVTEKAMAGWPEHTLRPVCLLAKPERIEITAPIPDYPPMLFIYKGKTHKIIKADGPERIEQEWWLQQGEHRDYYNVEDESGARYWLFRLGHYGEGNPEWFIHGFFA